MGTELRRKIYLSADYMSLPTRPGSAHQPRLARTDDRALLRTFSLGLIAEVLIKGLMVPGDYDRDGHHPWPHLSGDASKSITHEWLTKWPDEIPMPGAIVWQANTSAGDEIARDVLAPDA